MPRFSERLGLVQVVIQTDSMTEALRNSIWNLVGEIFRAPFGELGAIKMITIDVLRLPLERIDNYPRDWLLKRVQSLGWPEVYDLLDYAVQHAHTLSGP